MAYSGLVCQYVAHVNNIL